MKPATQRIMAGAGTGIILHNWRQARFRLQRNRWKRLQSIPFPPAMRPPGPVHRTRSVGEVSILRPSSCWRGATRLADKNHAFTNAVAVELTDGIGRVNFTGDFDVGECR